MGWGIFAVGYMKVGRAQQTDPGEEGHRLGNEKHTPVINREKIIACA